MTRVAVTAANRTAARGVSLKAAPVSAFGATVASRSGPVRVLPQSANITLVKGNSVKGSSVKGIPVKGIPVKGNTVKADAAKAIPIKLAAAKAVKPSAKKSLAKVGKPVAASETAFAPTKPLAKTIPAPLQKKNSAKLAHIHVTRSSEHNPHNYPSQTEAEKIRSIAELLSDDLSDDLMNLHHAGLDHGLVHGLDSCDTADELLLDDEAVFELTPELTPEQTRLEQIKTEKMARQAAAKAKAWELASLQSDPVLARRDQVVLEHLPLVKAIAVRVHENLPVHVDLDDLVHAGILGLFDAASKFNPEKQVAFSSYAKHRIKGAILDSLQQLDWASRDMRRRHKQLEAATRDLASKLQRNPTEAEIAEKLGMDAERWRTMMLDLRNVGLISASTRANENEDLPAPDFPSKPETHPDSICAHEQLRGVLGVAIKTLPERYQKVVSLYYSGEMTMKEIGGMLGINESRVSQIHKSALEKMQVVLESNGITNAQAF